MEVGPRHPYVEVVIHNAQCEIGGRLPCTRRTAQGQEEAAFTGAVEGVVGLGQRPQGSLVMCVLRSGETRKGTDCGSWE